MHALHRAAAVLLVTGLAAVPAGGVASSGPAARQCLGHAVTLAGTARSDRLVGTPGADVIAGFGGNDRIDGAGGADLVCGGSGADRLEGGPGADRIHGGRDALVEGTAGSYLLGDVLSGGPGADVLEGGTDPRDAASRRRPDTYTWADARRPVTVDLSGRARPGFGRATGRGHDTIALGSAHGIVGSPYADRIIGSARADWISGGDGGDVIRSGDGRDTIRADGSRGDRGRDDVEAGRGADLVSSLAGRDLVATGPGPDFVEAFGAEPSVVRLGPGTDYLGQNVTPGRGAGADGGAGDDVVTFYGTLLAGQRPAARFTVDHRTGVTSTSGEVAASGTVAGFERHRLVGPLRWRFLGGAGVDRVWAIQGGPLVARGRGGADSLVGSRRDDLLAGGSGSDYADGRGGRDDCRSIERGPC